MPRIATFAALLWLASSPARADVAPADSAFGFLSPLRAGATFMLGVSGGRPGEAVDAFIAYGPGFVGARGFSGAELFPLCSEQICERESQLNLVAGPRKEFAWGAASLGAGLGYVDRTYRDRIEREYAPWERPEYARKRFRGWGVPVQGDVYLSGRFIGLHLSVTAMADRGGGAGAVMAGVPLGYLRG